VWSAKGAKKHIITSAVEHHAVLDTCKWLGQNGCDVTILPTDKFGMIDPDSLANAIREDTLLVSVMHANNEVGTVNPIAKLGEICRNRGVIFHTDAVQSVGHMPVNLKELPVDMLTMSAHKMYGPKGVGALYIRKGLKLVPIIHGGGQEFGIYSGTENVPGIIGFGAAARLAVKLHEGGEEKRIALLRDKLINGVLGRIPDTVLTGHRAERLPFHASFCIRGADGSDILLEIDKAGIGGSSGSACTSGSTAPSYVLLAMGLDHGTAHGSVRLTLNKNTTEEDINYVLEKFPPIVKSLRSASRYGSDKMKRRS
ncbi:MAG: cysteine desulfurase, partial [Synergistaceae bacterium]|nr:cysteine desulfurase [Synergistaceae bacterium]